MAARPDEPKLKFKFSDDDKKLFVQKGGDTTVGRFILSATSDSNKVYFQQIVRNKGLGGAHAETRFINVAKHLIDLETKYTSISLDIKINYSPCGDCRSLLEGFLRIVRPALAPAAGGKLSLNIEFAMFYGEHGPIKEVPGLLKKWKKKLLRKMLIDLVDLRVIFIAAADKGPNFKCVKNKVLDPEFKRMKKRVPNIMWSDRESVEKTLLHNMDHELNDEESDTELSEEESDTELNDEESDTELSEEESDTELSDEGPDT